MHSRQIFTLIQILKHLLTTTGAEMRTKNRTIHPVPTSISISYPHTVKTQTSQINRGQRIVIVHFSAFEFERGAFVVVGVADEVVGIEGGGDDQFEEEVSRPQALRGGGGRDGRGRGEKIGTGFGAQIESFQTPFHLVDLEQGPRGFMRCDYFLVTHRIIV